MSSFFTVFFKKKFVVRIHGFIENALYLSFNLSLYQKGKDFFRPAKIRVKIW